MDFRYGHVPGRCVQITPSVGRRLWASFDGEESPYDVALRVTVFAGGDDEDDAEITAILNDADARTLALISGGERLLCIIAGITELKSLIDQQKAHDAVAAANRLAEWAEPFMRTMTDNAAFAPAPPTRKRR